MQEKEKITWNVSNHQWELVLEIEHYVVRGRNSQTLIRYFQERGWDKDIQIIEIGTRRQVEIVVEEITWERDQRVWTLTPDWKSESYKNISWEG
jgi:DNA integrity scanning protein DisA with diadenylate cyclase activity